MTADRGVGDSAALTVDDLRPDDLDNVTWAGNRAHLRSVAAKIMQATRGELDYLAVRGRDGKPVAIGAIEYGRPDSGEIGQLATRPDLQGQGFGSALIAAAEDRIRARGLRWAVLGVEIGNHRAERLYARLGYEQFTVEQDSWLVEDEAGNLSKHETPVNVLRKELR